MPVSRNVFRAVLFSLSIALTGCGVQSGTPVTHSELSGVHGTIFGGQQPISGSTVQLYTVGTSGDGSPATPLLTQSVTTGSDGSFTLTNLFSCTGATQVYLVGTGGNPGVGSSNPNLALMVALGPCSGLTSNTFISVNELTTVAAVSALAPYMTSLSSIGSGSADATALASAFTLAGEYVNTSSGTTPGVNVPVGYTVPVSQIDTLADVLSSCINSAGGTAGDTTNCGQFFTLTTPVNGTAAGNTITALLNLANNPTLNTPALFNLTPSIAPFQPQMTSAPPDFRIRLTPPTSSVALQISPSSLSFPAGTIYFPSTAQPVTITNTGTTAVTLSGIVPTGSNAADFSVVSACPASLGAGLNCPVQVTATPSGVGARVAYLSVSSSSPASPQYIPMTATGVAGTNSQVSLSATSLSWTYNNYLATFPVTMTNAGNTNVAIGGITINSGFTQTNNCGTLLPAQSLCTINVTAPQTDSGTYNGTLTVTDSAASGIQSITLTDYLDPSYTAYDFGTVRVNNKWLENVTLSGSAVSGDRSVFYTQYFRGCGCDFPVTFTPTVAVTQPTRYTLVTSTNTVYTGVATNGPALEINPPVLSAVFNASGLSSGTVSAYAVNSGVGGVTPSAPTMSGPNASLFTIVYDPSNNPCPTGYVLPQDSRCSYLITFTPTTAGTQHATINITDEATGLLFTTIVSGTTTYGPPQFTVNPSAPSNVFKAIPVGTTSTVQSQLAAAPLGNSMTAVLTTGTQFHLVKSSCAQSESPCYFNVTFAPTTPGTLNDTLTVTDTVSKQTATLPLSGTGGVPVASLSTTSLTFVDRAVNTTSIALPVTVTNTGNTGLIVSSVSLTGTNATDYSQTNNCVGTVAVNASCTVSINFSPTVAGTRTASLQILSNDPNSPTLVTITGTAH